MNSDYYCANVLYRKDKNHITIYPCQMQVYLENKGISKLYKVIFESIKS